MKKNICLTRFSPPHKSRSRNKYGCKEACNKIIPLLGEQRINENFARTLLHCKRERKKFTTTNYVDILQHTHTRD